MSDKDECPGNPVRWFEIYVQNMDRAKRFYETVFAVSLTALESPGIEMWSFPMVADGGGATGALVKMDGMPSGGNSTIVYFGCDDCAVESERIAGAGGHVFKSKFSIGQYGFIALALDTEGNMFGMHSTR